MKHKLFILIFLLWSGAAISQETDSTATTKKKDNRPVRSPFESGLLIDHQTVVISSAKTLGFAIQHRFGTLNSGTFDMLGLYAPSNIRIGLDYSVCNYFQIGVGSTKNNKIQDVNWKWSIIQQTRSGSIPASITYFGNIEYDARDKENFGIEYKRAHKLSYFHQLILSRKVNRIFSIQLAASYSHYNQIDTTAYAGMKHDNVALSVCGRVKFSPQSSIIFEYDYPLTTPEQIKSNIGLGIEVGTSSHAFQVFLGSFDGISYQRNTAYNTNDFTKKDVLLGFNITRLWNF